MRTRSILATVALATVLSGALFMRAQPSLDTLTGADVAARQAPQRDTTFGAHILRLSEDGGYFDTDNLISNERSYLHVASVLRARGGGDAYIGVGPDQNFAYIALLRPEVAYIVDIRRDNLLAHLLFKALFERSGTRAAYLAGLTGRAAAPEGRTLQEIVAWIDSTAMDPHELARVQRDVRARIEAYGYPLSDDDHAVIERIHETFARQGLSLRFASHGRAPLSHYPSYRDLLLETDRTGTPAGSFADEASYAFLRRMQQEDRIVPVVGDFAGSHALRAIAEELRANGLNVRAFYTSNVEYYLFRSGSFEPFARNASLLPWSADGVIIRSVFRGGSPSLTTHALPGYGSIQVAQPAHSFVERIRNGGYSAYADLTAHDVLPPQ